MSRIPPRTDHNEGPYPLTTQAIVERFEALCEELNCCLLIHKEHDGVFCLMVDRGPGPAPIEAHFVALAPGRTIYRTTEEARK